ncbi:GTPase IMAP family member 6-like [Sinocyclocheilus grahami]|uniref:GTPase IMAP family member 6-like n=1 Tax=Sinocyclocheilus grahami TaxID=75366 RepID=UPI0007AD692D|nr:PREDICTED: GTPase IMAP family member 6-like [Sinocyclocheilus grahami]
MAAIPRRVQSEDSDRRPLISHDGTITGCTGSATELRFIILGGDEDLMADACDIILRERAGRTEIQHRKGHVFGKKVIVLKTPSTWMSQVASCLCFSSRVKSIKDEMVYCASLVFPGPHAFLLVTDNSKVTGKERYLLRAIAEVFGKEALDYVMLLIIGRTEPKGIDSVRNYVRKFYTLEDTEQSVQCLFRETEIMTQNNESTFFIQPSYENLMKKVFLSWEKERDAEIQKQHAQEMTALEERFRTTESNLKKETDTLRELMLATMIRLKKYKDSEEQNQQGASGAQEDLLFKECSNTALKNMFPSIIDDFTERDNALKEQLAACKDTVSTLKDMFSSLTDDYVHHDSQIKSENEKLQRELEQHKLKEREWEQKLKELEDRLRQEKGLSRREKELESKEGGTAKKEQEIQTTGEEHNLHRNVELTSPGLSQEQRRPLDERGELSKDEDSHDSESLEFGKPSQIYQR